MKKKNKTFDFSVTEELRKIRNNAGEPEERIVLRHQIEATRGELDASNSYLVALKYELSKTQVNGKYLKKK